MRMLPILLFVLLVSTFAQGDEVKMVGGDVLHGEIIEETDDLIVLIHDVLGRVAIHRSGVASLARNENIRLEVCADFMVQYSCHFVLQLNSIIGASFGACMRRAI